MHTACTRQTLLMALSYFFTCMLTLHSSVCVCVCVYLCLSLVIVTEILEPGQAIALSVWYLNLVSTFWVSVRSQTFSVCPIICMSVSFACMRDIVYNMGSLYYKNYKLERGLDLWHIATIAVTIVFLSPAHTNISDYLDLMCGRAWTSSCSLYEGMLETVLLLN